MCTRALSAADTLACLYMSGRQKHAQFTCLINKSFTHALLPFNNYFEILFKNCSKNQIENLD